MIRNEVNLTQGIEELINNGTLVNCTPHMLNIILADGKKLVVEPSGVVPRCSATTEEVAPGVVVNILGEVEGLPEMVPGKLLVVSTLVRTKSGREDLVSPNTSPSGVVRDPEGNIIGSRGIQL